MPRVVWRAMMFGKNLEYYRLKAGMTKKALAEKCGLTTTTISNYELGKRSPESIDIVKHLASALGIRMLDFMTTWNEELHIECAEYRKQKSCLKKSQDYVRSAVEEYLNRFYTIVEVLGEKVLPEVPTSRSLQLARDADTNALNMRRHLKLALIGSVGNIIERLENLGFIVFEIDFDEGIRFSGMNGSVNGRPYIVLNRNMPPAVKRSTLAHELAHMMFDWSSFAGNAEKEATAIGGAFLFPKEDAIRELGLKRISLTKDLFSICREYGISYRLLVTRAKICGIISESVAKNFYIQANKYGWQYNDPMLIAEETPTLFEQLVFRAVNQNEISFSQASDLLKQSCESIIERCMFTPECDPV